jgi:hypothetical protein
MILKNIRDNIGRPLVRFVFFFWWFNRVAVLDVILIHTSQEALMNTTFTGSDCGRLLFLAKTLVAISNIQAQTMSRMSVDRHANVAVHTVKTIMK